MPKPPLVLLGAGSSVEAGIPATVDMTQEILRRFQDDWQLQEASKILSFVVGGLMFQRGIRGENPYQGVDVEELFAAVLLLSRRQSLEAAPFVGSWHAMVEELDRRRNYSGRQSIKKVVEGLYKSTVEELAKNVPTRINIRGRIEEELADFVSGKRKKPPDIDKAIEQALMKLLADWFTKAKRGRPRMPSFLDKEFSRAVESQQALPGEGGPFEDTAEGMIRALTGLVWLDDAGRVDYLEPLLTMAYNHGRLTVATLNYDNSVELLGAAHSQAVHVGLDGWSKSGQFAFPTSGISLIKLHGSIDWVLRPEGPTEEAPLSRQSVRVATAEELAKPGFRPAVVFGQGSKLTAEGPFLDLLRSFREELSKHSQLLVVGYSFRDEHVNEYIAQWFNGGSARGITIVDPGFADSRSDFARQLRRLTEPRLRVISEPASRGLVEASSEPGD